MTTSAQTAFISDNHTMTAPSSSPLRHILRAPFSRRAWAELTYAIVSLPLAVGALVFIIPTLLHGILWAASAPGVRRLGAANRSLGRTLLGENVPPPPPLRPNPYVRVRTPDADRLAALTKAEGAQVRLRGNRVRIIGLSGPPVSELAAEERITVHALRPESSFGWVRGAVEADRALTRGLLGPPSPGSTALAKRVRDLEKTRAHAVDAIAERLVASDRAVEKHISNIFSKLGLPPSDSDHRQVLAVLAYLGS